MINLLPLSEKEAQHKERRTRAVTVFLALFILVEVVSTVSLTAPYFLASAKVKILKMELATLEQKMANQGGESYTDVVRSTNEKLAYFLNADKRPEQDSTLIAKVMSLVPDGISVTDIAVSPAVIDEKKNPDMPKTARAMYIGGVAANRTALLAFVDALKAGESIVDVVLPVSNFTQSTNIDFSVTFIVY